MKREGPLGDVIGEGHLRHGEHKITAFSIGEARRGVSRTATLDFQRAEFGLFRRLVDGIPWEADLKSKRVQEGWTVFKKEILQEQEQDQASPMCQKMN